MWSTLWDHQMLPVQWGAVIGASLVGAATDIRSRRISNRLSGATLVGGFVFAGMVGGGAGVVESALGCVLLAFPYVLLFVFAGGGAGDAKLMGAIGAWLGIMGGGVVLASVAASGVVLALGYALAQRRLGPVLANIQQIVSCCTLALCCRAPLSGVLAGAPPAEKMKTIPYGVAIFVGVVAAAGGIWLWRS